MNQYQRSWLNGKPVDEYISAVRAQKWNQEALRRSCQEDYARHYHEADRPWWGDQCWVFVVLTLTLNIISIFIKRSFLENAFGGNWGAMTCYCLSEFAGVAAVVVGVRVRQRSTFNRSVWLLAVTIVTLAGDLGSAAYSGGSQYGAKVDGPQYVYLVIQVTTEALKLKEPMQVIYRQLGEYVTEGNRFNHLWNLFAQGFPPDTQFAELPTDERLWVCATLLDVLDSGSQPCAWGPSAFPPHPGIWFQIRTVVWLFGQWSHGRFRWFSRKFRWFLAGFWWTIKEFGNVCSYIWSYINRNVRGRSSSPPEERLPPPASNTT